MAKLSTVAHSRQFRAMHDVGMSSEQSRHAAYSSAKATWLAKNPAATPDEIEAAFRAIAERLGI